MKTENLKQIRRIQLSGGSTYTVSLPKSWVDELKIKAGKNVTIVKNPNQSLTLFPSDDINEKKAVAVISLNQKESWSSIKRKIIATYLRGYSNIRVVSKGIRIPLDHSRNIRDLVRASMIGTEIVESSANEITIQILSRLPELSFETALKRMHLIVNNMVREAVESFEEGDCLHASEVVSMDDEVDRFGLYMRRNLALAVENENILQDMGLRRPSDCLGYNTVINRIERIADHACLIAKRTKLVEGKIDSEILVGIKNLFERSLEIFKRSIAAVQEHDFKKGEKIAAEINHVINEEEMIKSTIKDTGKNSTIIRFVLEDLRRIAEYSGDITEVVIDEDIQSIISEDDKTYAF